MPSILVINPATRTIYEDEAEEGRVHIRAREIIGTDNLGHWMPFSDQRGVGCFVDDVGALPPRIRHSFMLGGYPDPIHGTAVFYREDVGDLRQPLVDHGLDPQRMRMLVRWREPLTIGRDQ